MIVQLQIEYPEESTLKKVPVFSSNPFEGYKERMLLAEVERLKKALRKAKNSNRTFKGHTTKRKKNTKKNIS